MFNRKIKKEISYIKLDIARIKKELSCEHKNVTFGYKLDFGYVKSCDNCNKTLKKYNSVLEMNEDALNVLINNAEKTKKQIEALKAQLER